MKKPETPDIQSALGGWKGGEDNEARLDKLTNEFIDIYEEDSGYLVHLWVSDLKNYFDFELDRPEKQPETDNDKKAPSMESINTVTTAIEMYILSRLTHRIAIGGDHQNMTIRVTVDDGTERHFSFNMRDRWDNKHER